MHYYVLMTHTNNRAKQIDFKTRQGLHVYLYFDLVDDDAGLEPEFDAYDIEVYDASGNAVAAPADIEELCLEQAREWIATKDLI